FPGLLKARADQFVLEFAGRELSEVDLWKRYGEGRELGAGVIDVKGFNQDTVDEVASRIRRVLQVCPAEKLTVNPDCGFGWSPPRPACRRRTAASPRGAPARDSRACISGPSWSRSARGPARSRRRRSAATGRRP